MQTFRGTVTRKFEKIGKFEKFDVLGYCSWKKCANTVTQKCRLLETQ